MAGHSQVKVLDAVDLEPVVTYDTPAVTLKGTEVAYNDETGTDTLAMASVAISNGASIVVCVVAADEFGAVSSVDWNGSALTKIIANTNSSHVNTEMWWKHGVTGATGTVTVTMSSSSDAAAIVCSVYQITNLAVSGVDQYFGSTGNDTSPTSGAITTTQSDEVLIGCVGMETYQATVGGSWQGSFGSSQDIGSSYFFTSGDVAISTAHRVVTSIGQYTAAKTGARNAQWSTIISSLKASSSVSDGTENTSGFECLLARQVVFTVTATDAGTIDHVTVQVSNDGTNWQDDNGTSYDVFGTVAAAALNTGGQKCVVAPKLKRGMPWKYVRLNLVGDDAVSNITVIADGFWE